MSRPKIISGSSRAFIVIFSIFSIIFLLGGWIKNPFNPSAISMPGSDDISLIEIAEALGFLNNFADEPIVAIVAGIFYFGTIITAIFFVITAITAFTATTRDKLFLASMWMGYFMSGGFLLLMLYADIESNNSLGISLLELTLNPFLLLILSIVIDILSRSGSPLRGPVYSPAYSPAPTKRANLCTFCGAELETSSEFCPVCGGRTFKSDGHFTRSSAPYKTPTNPSFYSSPDLRVSPTPLATSTSSTAPTSRLIRKPSREQILSNGGWECRQCGRANLSHIATCICGNPKSAN